MQIKHLTIGIVLVLLFQTIAAADTNGGYAGAFLRMGLGAEACAQGDAFVARADNGFAAYYNPAGLSFLPTRSFAVSYSNLSLDRSLHYVGLTFPLKPTAGLSLGWINAGVSDIDGRDYDGNHYGTLSYHDNAFAFAFANRFSDFVAVGVGVKVLYSLFPKLLEDDKALKSTAVGIDVGILVKPVKTIRIGLQAKDINGKNSWDTSKYYSEGSTRNDEFPTIYNAGIALVPNEEISVEYDFEASSEDVVEHHFGLEYAVINDAKYRFDLRFGYDGDKPTFGFGYRFPMMETTSVIDAAYLIDEISPSDTMIFSWSILF